MQGPDVAHPRRASVSAFGFGGTNFHVTLEEYRGEHRPARLRAVPAELVVLSAASADALAARCRALASDLRTRRRCRGSPRARRVRVAARVRREGAGTPRRRRGLGRGARDEPWRRPLRGSRRRRPEVPRRRPAGSFFSLSAVEAPPQVAFLFPGQGSQAVAMGGELAVHVDACRAVLDRLATRSFGGERLQSASSLRPPSTTRRARASRRASRRRSGRSRPWPSRASRSSPSHARWAWSRWPYAGTASGS